MWKLRCFRGIACVYEDQLVLPSPSITGGTGNGYIHINGHHRQVRLFRAKAETHEEVRTALWNKKYTGDLEPNPTYTVRTTTSRDFEIKADSTSSDPVEIKPQFSTGLIEIEEMLPIEVTYAEGDKAEKRSNVIARWLPDNGIGAGPLLVES